MAVAAAAAPESNHSYQQPHQVWSNYNCINLICRYAISSLSQAQTYADVNEIFDETIGQFSSSVWRTIIPQNTQGDIIKIQRLQHHEMDDAILLGAAAERCWSVVVSHAVLERSVSVNAPSPVEMYLHSYWQLCLLVPALMMACCASTNGSKNSKTTGVNQQRKIKTVRALVSLGAHVNACLGDVAQFNFQYKSTGVRAGVFSYNQTVHRAVRTGETTRISDHLERHPSIAGTHQRGIPLFLEGLTPLMALARRKDPATIVELVISAEKCRRLALAHNVEVRKQIAVIEDLIAKQLAEEKDTTQSWLAREIARRQEQQKEDIGGNMLMLEQPTLPLDEEDHEKKLVTRCSAAASASSIDEFDDVSDLFPAAQIVANIRRAASHEENGDDDSESEVEKRKNCGGEEEEKKKEKKKEVGKRTEEQQTEDSEKAQLRPHHRASVNEIALLRAKLIPAPAPLNFVLTDIEGNTALHHAIMSKTSGPVSQRGSCETVLTILHFAPHLVDMRRNKAYPTPLMLCCKAGNIVAARALFESITRQYEELGNRDPAATEIDVHATMEPAGCTAMHMAAESNCRTLVELLYEHGAELSVRDKTARKSTPADYAVANKHARLASLIRKMILQEVEEEEGNQCRNESDGDDY